MLSALNSPAAFRETKREDQTVCGRLVLLMGSSQEQTPTYVTSHLRDEQLISAERKSSAADLKRGGGVSFSDTRGLPLPTYTRSLQRFHARVSVRVVLRRIFCSPRKGEAAGVTERGEPGRRRVICGSRCGTDSFYVRLAISAPARLEAAVQLLRK